MSRPKSYGNNVLLKSKSVSFEQEGKVRVGEYSSFS